MCITKRRYSLLADFNKVSNYLDQCYSLPKLNSYLLQPFFEYAHTHPGFEHQLTHRFTLWEDGDKLVGITCFEMGLGEAYLSTLPEYQYLLPEMLKQAELELYKMEAGKKTLEVYITDKELDKIELLKEHGYKKIHTWKVTTYDYKKGFTSPLLPEGFEMISLLDENDPLKIHHCQWKGFNHQGPPNNDFDCRLLMQSGPHFSKELTTVIKAPNGDYACFAGMWFNPMHNYAYLEPLCTIPEYRKMGLGRVALMEAMKKTKALGATYCFGGDSDFYINLGFEVICHREVWSKTWS